MRSVDFAFREVHPHAFRHHFNYGLSVTIDQHNAKARTGNGGANVAPISEAREQDVRAFLNGHRSKASGAIYNRRHTRAASDKAMRQVQAGLNRPHQAREEDDDSRWTKACQIANVRFWPFRKTATHMTLRIVIGR